MDSKDQMDLREEAKEIQWEVEKEDSKDSKAKEQEAKGIRRQRARAKGGNCQTEYSKDTATSAGFRGTRRSSAHLWDWDFKGNVNIVD